MTEQERIIVSAYTGYLLCDFDKVHEYIEKKMGRPVWTHELATKVVWEEIRDRCREDFIALKEPEKRTQERTETHACDCISRRAAIDGGGSK